CPRRPTDARACAGCVTGVDGVMIKASVQEFSGYWAYTPKLPARRTVTATVTSLPDLLITFAMASPYRAATGG
ncbi:MAG TPA: hypothetical protein DDY14_07855, partial [Chromatiaceae bacterium]|nr:hypothetical protein [Chromatiaceae bacterium]